MSTSGISSAPTVHRRRFTTSRASSRAACSTLRAAAVAGVGVVQLPTMMVRDQLARGELVAVVPEWAPRREIVHAVFASRRGLLPSVRALIDFLADRFQRLDED